MIGEQMYLINQNDILLGSHKRPATGILARLIQLQTEFLCQVLLVIDQVTSLRVGGKDDLQTFT
jgi:hypothetical protein